jgi:hypothetical protein
LRPKPGNPPPHWFWASTKKLIAHFEAKPGETVATSFEAKLEKTVGTGFEAKPDKTIATSFEVKPVEIVAAGFDAKPPEIVEAGFEAKPPETDATGFEAKLAKTVDLGFEAQPRNPRSSSLRAWCRPHKAPLDLSIARPPSTRPVRSSPVLCTRSPTPATILIAAHHAAPATCTPRDKQTRFSKQNKEKRKKQNKTIPNLNSNLSKSMTHHNQTKELTT